MGREGKYDLKLVQPLTPTRHPAFAADPATAPPAADHPHQCESLAMSVFQSAFIVPGGL